MKIYVVTVQYKSSDFTKTCIEAFRESTLPITKYIIVDNNSGGNHKEIFRNIDDIHLIERNYNSGTDIDAYSDGWEYAYNEGADFIISANNDAVVSNTCVERCIEVFKQSNQVGVVCPCYTQGNAWDWCTEVAPDNIFNEMNITNGRDRKHFNEWAAKDIPDVYIHWATWTDTTMLVFDRYTTEKVGYFDKNVLSWQEQDYAIRCMGNYIKIAVAHNAHFWHKVSGTRRSTDAPKVNRLYRPAEKIIKIKYPVLNFPIPISLTHMPLNHPCHKLPKGTLFHTHEAAIKYYLNEQGD